MQGISHQDRKKILELIADNTALPKECNQLGIFRFAKVFFPERFDKEFAELHYEMVSLLFQLMDPLKENLADRQAYFLVHRQSAKSTISTFLLPIFLTFMKGHSIFVRKRLLDWDRETPIIEWMSENNDVVVEIPIQEDYIVICSETGSMAEDLVGELRTVIDTRQDLANLFGEKKPKLLKWDRERNDSKIWRRNTFVTSDNTVIRGVGTGMQIRGRQMRGRRPSLIIIDDMYSEENVKTEQSRENLYKWFFNACINSCDSERGKVLWLGTMIHADTVIKTFKKSEFWFGLSKPIISSLELRVMIDRCIEQGFFDEPGFFRSDKSREILRQWESLCYTMSWPQKHNLRGIMMLYKQSMDEGKLNYFYQEYMCEYNAPETQMLMPDSFRQIDLNLSITNGKQIVEYLEIETGITWIGNVILNIGVDPAASRNDNSDDTAIVVGGLCRFYPKIPGRDWQSVFDEMQIGRVLPVILHIEGGKYATHNYEDMFGICEQIYKLTEKFKINTVYIEAQGQQQHIVWELKRFLKELQCHVKVREEFTQTKKDERIRSIVYTLAQRYGYFLCQPNKLVDKMYIQALNCGLIDHEDYADSLAITFKEAIEPPLSFTGFKFEDEHIATESRWDRLKKVPDGAYLM